MNLQKLSIITLILTLFVIWGCEENNTITNEYIQDTSSSVIGRFLIEEDSIDVFLWQEELEATTQTDNEGYFEFLNLEPGIYELRTTVDEKEHVQKNIEVKKNETTSLGEIKFNSTKHPFISFIPADNSEDVVLDRYSTRLRRYLAA